MKMSIQSNTSGRLIRCLSTATLVAALSGVANAQVQMLPHHYEPYDYQSNAFDGNEEGEFIALTDTIETDSAPFMRIHFGDYNLGEASFLTLTSYRDGGWQRLDARSLPEWNNASAYFNGNKVDIELHVAPGDQGVYFDIAQIEAGEYEEGGEPEDDGGVASLCGADSRVASTDPASGRLFLFGGCTAWLISNGAVLTAGHCVDGDPDGGGAGLPDGMLDNGFINAVVGFNVPASSANGNAVAPSPDDQYPVSLSYVAWVHWGSNGSFNSVGRDWCVFTLGANSNTGLRPHIAQNAFYRVSLNVPDPGDTIRITGYGLDNTPSGSGGAGAACCDSNGDGNCEFNCNSANLTEQTSTGPYDSYSSSGDKQIHYYQVDTMPANSGSPIIRTSTGKAIGIHTNAGCTNSGGQNAGTSFNNDLLGEFAHDFPGPNTVYVDAADACLLFCFGSLFNPYGTVTEGVAGVPNGGIVSIVKGNYTQAAGNTFTAGTGGKAMTLQAPVGTVTIGN